MKSIPTLLFTTLLTATCGAAIALTASAAEFVLVAKGTPPAPVIVFKGAPPRTRDAAVTLAEYLGRLYTSPIRTTINHTRGRTRRPWWLARRKVEC